MIADWTAPTPPPIVKIASTQDVSLHDLQRAVERLPIEWQAEVDESQFFARALEAPSWIAIAAQVPWWTRLLGGAASVYVVAILNEAGEDTWRNRGKLAAAVREAGSAVSRLADFILDASAAASNRTIAYLQIPMSNGFDELKLRLDYDTREELEFEIALFVHFVPQLESLMAEDRLQGNSAVGGLHAEFGSTDYSMLVSWLDRVSLDRKEIVLELSGAS